eukprot:241976-Chlamydomonas_euryale.AAC.4
MNRWDCQGGGCLRGWLVARDGVLAGEGVGRGGAHRAVPRLDMLGFVFGNKLDAHLLQHRCMGLKAVATELRGS